MLLQISVDYYIYTVYQLKMQNRVIFICSILGGGSEEVTTDTMHENPPF